MFGKKKKQKYLPFTQVFNARGLKKQRNEEGGKHSLRVVTKRGRRGGDPDVQDAGKTKFNRQPRGGKKEKGIFAIGEDV